MRKINKIIIHCSASYYGDQQLIDGWHRNRGFKSCGYHWLILNGYRTYSSYNRKEITEKDIGLLEKGRDEELIGAHVKGMNFDTIGICLIGKNKFHKKQFKTLEKLLISLLVKYKLKVNNILGHYECPSGIIQEKTCPNFSVSNLRQQLKPYIWFKKLLFKLLS